VRVLGNDASRGLQIVEGRNQDVAFGAVPDVCAGRIGLGEIGRVRRKQTGDADVIGTVVSAFEFQHLRSFAECARESLAIQGRFRPGGAEPERVTSRAQAYDLLRKPQGILRDIGEIGT
jgi:hypothetical protein